MPLLDHVTKEQKIFSNFIKLLFLSICFALFTIVQVKFDAVSKLNLNGVLAQMQVVVSVFMVLSVKKWGYIAATFLNVILSFVILFRFVLNDMWFALPGVFVPICTIITISIISNVGRKLNDRMFEINKQKEKLSHINEELAKTHNELEKQNRQLQEYNKKMHENEEKLRKLAYFDVLTELPNRKMIINKLETLLNSYEYKYKKIAVVFIDLDNFKKVNDSMGHHVGDELLQVVSSKLKGSLHQHDMLGRLGGDEFAIIIETQFDGDGLFEYIDNFRKSLIDKIIIGTNEIDIRASFGVAVYPKDGENSQDLLKSADTAMYKAKELGKNSVQFFDKEMKEEILRKIKFENNFIKSIYNQEFYFVYQPQYIVESNRIRGFELLARWKMQSGEIVGPDVFIPIAEETGLILKLGDWILNQACVKLREMQNKYDVDLVISINISSIQFFALNFIESVKNALKRNCIEGKYIEFELTEEIFARPINEIEVIMLEIKKIGIKICIDNFGAGRSSLKYLKSLPINTIKIDKSYVKDIEKEEDIIGDLISIIHKFNILVIAEGVETTAQLDYLKEQYCDFIQGFLLGTPLKEIEFKELIYKLNKK